MTRSARFGSSPLRSKRSPAISTSRVGAVLLQLLKVNTSPRQALATIT
ncbi:hypothetical protein [Halochromatium salexigens]|nr:hypothetical protein [Halochromatium salexigens]